MPFGVSIRRRPFFKIESFGWDKIMEKFTLNGQWNISSKTYDVVGEIPGSVYTALLANGLMEDPFYRDNEAKALAIMDEAFVFTKEFEYTKKSESILLVCEGIDTL